MTRREIALTAGSFLLGALTMLLAFVVMVMVYGR
jgi:hypothetical protein